jgi:hypothetical protein
MIVDTEKIELELKSKLTGIADSIHTSVPDTRVKDKTFIVVSVDSAVVDEYAYYYTIASVQIFVPNLSTGEKNSSMFTKIIDAINRVFPIVSDIYEFDIFPNVIILGNDNKGYYVKEIQIKTLIHK